MRCASCQKHCENGQHYAVFDILCAEFTGGMNVAEFVRIQRRYFGNVIIMASSPNSQEYGEFSRIRRMLLQKFGRCLAKGFAESTGKGRGVAITDHEGDLRDGTRAFLQQLFGSGKAQLPDISGRCASQ